MKVDDMKSEVMADQEVDAVSLAFDDVEVENQWTKNFPEFGS